MKKIVYALVLFVSFGAVAQQNVPDSDPFAPIKPEMTATQKKLLSTETMRSPVYTKMAYRQAKSIDKAVSSKQNLYVAKKAAEKKWNETEADAERERISTMREFDYGQEKADLATKAAAISKDPVQAFADLATNVEAGGYGWSEEELRQLRTGDAPPDSGLTEEELNLVRQEQDGLKKKVLGTRAVYVTPEQVLGGQTVAPRGMSPDQMYQKR